MKRFYLDFCVWMEDILVDVFSAVNLSDERLVIDCICVRKWYMFK